MTYFGHSVSKATKSPNRHDMGGWVKRNPPKLELFITSEHDLGPKKRIKYQNNVRNVFRDVKLPSENIMRHCDGKYQSLEKEVELEPWKWPFQAIFCSIEKFR